MTGALLQSAVFGVVGFLLGGLTTFGLVQGRLAALEQRAGATEVAVRDLHTHVLDLIRQGAPRA